MKTFKEKMYFAKQKGKACHQQRREEFIRLHHENDFRHQQHYNFCHREKFDRFHRNLKYIRPVTILFNLLLFYLLFRWIGIKTISIVFVLFISIKEILQLFFLWRLEKRVISPIEKLQTAVEEIAQGNYDVKIEASHPIELDMVGPLFYSFNDMAEKLLHSEKLKEEYEVNRKTLIANISHDLKTPITSARGYIEAILEGVVTSPEKANQYLKTVYSDIGYMNKLIDDLFLFSQLDLQKLSFHFEVFSVSLYMNDLMEEFKFDFEEKGAIFRYKNEIENDLLVKMDRKRLHQAIRNILDNAVKYGPEKELKLSIELLQNEDFVLLKLEDNGSGISADQLPFIFDRFYRIDSERTKDLCGTGLGLAIAKELIEAHDGEIFVTSVVNEGTCFTISLPIIKKECEGGEYDEANTYY